MKRPPDTNCDLAALSDADHIIANAFALATALGITEREISAAAMRLAVFVAEKQANPDAWLADVLKLKNGGH